ncbi:MAG: hypothetical protein J6X99_00830 [Bacteroidales bacterium]|nr:hypothetical protein [Bacteroidales bacterium]
MEMSKKTYLAPQAAVFRIESENLCSSSPTGEFFDEPIVYDGFAIMEIL